MTVQEVLDNIEQYDTVQQEAIRLAVETQEGEALEQMIKAIVG